MYNVPLNAINQPYHFLIEPMKNIGIRKWFVVSWLSVIFLSIALLFWHNEWVYSLPTPVPPNYTSVKPGDYIDLQGKLDLAKGKPVFLHFFNPACPCSRFNIKHFKSLVKAYNTKINFAIVVMSKDSNYTAREIQDKFGLSVPVLFDKAIAKACGVYSTPQAVILDNGDRLYYRGNYNRSRYCTDRNSNFAQMAIDSMLNHVSHPVFNPYALTAYGCTLPTCNK